MKKHFFFRITIITLCITLLSSCQKHVADVTLNKSELSLLQGETETLIATIFPDDAADKGVMWESDNSAVATVNEDGLVTAIDKGKASITVTTIDGGKTANCAVTVDYPIQHVTSVTLDKTELTLIPGATETLIPTILPDDATDQELTWTSSNTTVATVSEDGTVAAIDNGKAIITVTTADGGKTAKCTVTVDYRSQWVGDWDFVTVHSWWIMGPDIGSETIYYSGEITYGNASNELNIKFTENNSIPMYVDESGKLIYDDEYHYLYADGQFEENDKIYVKHWYEGVSHYVEYIINGTKK